jgi:3-methyladenine DNA glycosylase AlkD
VNIRATRHSQHSSNLANRIHSRLRQEELQNAASFHRVRREFSKQLRATPAEVVLDLVEELLERGSTSGRFLACGLVRNHPAAFLKLTARTLERLGAGMDSWSDVDIFATILAGHAWREGLVSDRVIHRWAHSRNKWWRRAALVSTVPLNVKAQGGRGDASRTLAVCDLLVRDREDLVVKALSWALRALAVRDPDAVSSFLEEHHTEVAPLVLREVRNKITSGRK